MHTPSTVGCDESISDGGRVHNASCRQIVHKLCVALSRAPPCHCDQTVCQRIRALNTCVFCFERLQAAGTSSTSTRSRTGCFPATGQVSAPTHKLTLGRSCLFLSICTSFCCCESEYLPFIFDIRFLTAVVAPTVGCGWPGPQRGCRHRGARLRGLRLG